MEKPEADSGYVALTDEQLERLIEATSAPVPAPVERQANPAPVEAADVSVRVVAQRDTDGPMGTHLQTFRMLDAIAVGNRVKAHAIQEHMKRAGLYTPELQNHGTERAVALTSAEGDPFLPTTVINTIEELREQFGLGRQLATVYNIDTGTAKVPNSTARPSVFAVNEGAVIKMRKGTFGNVTLDPKKWGVIVGYSSEMSDEVGAQWVQKTIDQVGRAFANAEDDTIWNADGTATYHSLTGLLNNGSIGERVMAAGKTDFEDTTRTELNMLIRAANYGARDAGAQFAFHPDLMYVFSEFQDGAGNYIYPPNVVPDRMIRPIGYTAALPALADTAISTSFGTFGDHSFVNMGVRKGVSIKLLDQATIQDTDDSTLIHLGAQDGIALRFTALWDVALGITGGLAKITTAAA